MEIRIGWYELFRQLREIVFSNFLELSLFSCYSLRVYVKRIQEEGGGKYCGQGEAAGQKHHFGEG